MVELGLGLDQERRLREELKAGVRAGKRIDRFDSPKNSQLKFLYQSSTLR
jgi:hypothetical protein